MDKVASVSAFFFLIYRVSICEAKELNILVLKSSSKLPISALVAPPLDDFWTLENVVSLLFNLFLEAPLEHLFHKLTISSYDSLDMSPFPSIFNISRQSSLTPFNNIVLRMSLLTLGSLDHCRLYCSLSTKSSRFSSSFCIILNSSSLFSLVRQ
jgi:hypothetical protein